MTNERAPEGSAGAGITRQLIPSQRREKLQLRQAAGAGPRRNGRDGKRREIFDLPTAHSPQPTAHSAQQGHTGAGKRILPSSPRASSSSMLPSFGFSRCTYRTRGRPPAARNVDLRLHRFLLAPRPGRHPLLAILWSIISPRPTSRITTPPATSRPRLHRSSAGGATPASRSTLVKGDLENWIRGPAEP